MELLNFTESLTHNTSLLDPEFTGRPTIRFKAEHVLTVRIFGPICVAIVLFGLISNILNTIVFLKAGAKDNVTILLLSLAVSDFIFLALITPTICGYVIPIWAPMHTWPFNPHILRFITYWPAFTAYDLSTYISVSLGVTRCACVAMPLKFKLVFTRSRTVKWVMFLVVFAILLRLPVLTVHKLAWKTDPKTNKTEAYLADVNYKLMAQINDLVNRGIMIYVSYITMVTCVGLLTFKLYQTSKIRRQCEAGKSSGISDQAGQKSIDQGLSSKDLQVVKAVVLVCTLFILLQFPLLLTSTTRLITSEFDNGGSLVYLFGILSQINRCCSYLNASLNIFIYYNYNSKYRSVLRDLFSVKTNK